MSQYFCHNSNSIPGRKDLVGNYSMPVKRPNKTDPKWTTQPNTPLLKTDGYVDFHKMLRTRMRPHAHIKLPNPIQQSPTMRVKPTESGPNCLPYISSITQHNRYNFIHFCKLDLFNLVNLDVEVLILHVEPCSTYKRIIRLYSKALQHLSSTHHQFSISRRNIIHIRMSWNIDLDIFTSNI